MRRVGVSAALTLGILVLGASAIAQSTACIDYRDFMRMTATVPGEARHLDRMGDLVYTSSLQVIDVSTPGRPVVVGSFAGLDGGVRGITATAAHLYVIYSAGDVAGFNGLAVYDLAVPTSPALVGSLTMPQFMTQLRVVGDRVYLRNDQGTLLIADVSDPAAPVARGRIGEDWLDSFDLDGNWLYAVDRVQGDVVVIDVTDPDALAVDYRLPLDGVISITFGPDYGYFLYANGGTEVLQFSGPDQFTLINTLPDVRRPLVLGGRWAYAYGLPLDVYDLADPAAPALALTAPFLIHDGVLDDNRLLVGLSNAFSELVVGTMPGTPATISIEVEATLAAMLPLGQAGLATLSRTGMETFDTSDCDSPQRRGGLPWQGTLRGHAIRGDHMFVLFQGAGFGRTDLKVYDLSDLAGPAEVAARTLNFELNGLTAVGDWLYSAELGGLIVLDAADPLNVSVHSQTMGLGFTQLNAVNGANMVVADGTLLRHFDISDPAMPVPTTSVETGVEGRQMLLSGGTAIFVHGGGALVYDVTSLGAKTLLGQIAVPGIVDGAVLDGTALYVEGSGIFVFDLTNPALALPVGSLGYEADRATHLTVVGDCLYFDHFLTGDRGRVVIAPTHCTDNGGGELTAMIDIKPGSDVNPINCRSGHGVIPVAILTTAEFDALTVDHTTVRFGPGEAREVHRSRGRDCDEDDDEGDDDKGRGGDRDDRGGRDDDDDGDRGRGHGRDDHDCAGELRRHEEDVDGDGDIDLVLHFANADAMIACGDTEVGLSGRTDTGDAFTGSDVICTVPGVCEDGVDAEKSLGAAALSLTLVPNPFNPQTTIAFELPSPRRLRVEVYDVTGRRVAVVADEVFGAGRHRLTWAGADDGGRPAASGVYFVRMTGQGVDLNRRALLLK